MKETQNNKYHLGVVKWFGGYNHQKERENDFGFIESMSGNDVFIHKNEIMDNDSLVENELVLFELGEKRGKYHAKNLCLANKDEKSSKGTLSLFVENHEQFSIFFDSYKVSNKLIEVITKNVENKNTSFIEKLKEVSKENLSIYKLISESKDWLEIFVLINNNSLKKLLDSTFPFEFIPPKFLILEENSYYKYVAGLEKDKRNLFFNENIKILPIYLILACIIQEILTDEKLIEYRFNEINHIIEDKFKNNVESFPAYVEELFNTKFKSNKDYLLNPTMRKILEPIFLKRRVFNKSVDIKQYFDQCTTLKGDTECFILANLFSLLQIKNNLDTTYKIFLHRLWEALVIEDININDKGILNLFPSCNTMGHSGLSCEAVYWPKIEKYLCRGRVCSNPQVKVEAESTFQKHYLDYNIYDWFHYYEIDYINDGEPSNKDFPIKLAGYFNRLKEIFNVLKCRQCDKLMKPDMKYARVEYIDYESGVPVKKSMSAAYRATVFECGNEICIEHKNTYYINHCLGFGCGSLIDTRDLIQKCDSGLYICRGCGSCCEQHAKANPVGLCPDCGSSLNLFENQNESDKFGNFQRFVKCSNASCSFTIDENLPKKFTLPSCTPVKKLAVENNIEF